MDEDGQNTLLTWQILLDEYDGEVDTRYVKGISLS
jgi:hypothetical protein